jgi:CRISPR-associated protein Csm2
MGEIRLWKDKEKKLMDPTLFSKVADKLADDFAREGGNRKNRRSQIRKFYDEVVRINSLARERPQQWDAIKPQVHMLTAKAAYAEGRQLVTTSFTSFIKNCVAQIEDRDDLNLFSNLFEAFMGFFQLYQKTK